jgi:hypothetical protein
MSYEGRIECASGYAANIGNATKAACAATIPQPTRSRETDEAYERLCSEVAMAEELLGALMNRLAPVLRPHVEAPATDRACIGYASSLAGRIGGQADRAEVIGDAICNVLDRLEV